MPFGAPTITALPPCFAASDPVITPSQRSHLCCNLGAIPGQLPAAAGFPCGSSEGTAGTGGWQSTAGGQSPRPRGVCSCQRRLSSLGTSGQTSPAQSFSPLPGLQLM